MKAIDYLYYVRQYCINTSCKYCDFFDIEHNICEKNLMEEVAPERAVQIVANFMKEFNKHEIHRNN